MGDEQFQERQEAGDKRVQARNLAEMNDKPLEGPGSQERLDTLRSRFRGSGKDAEGRMPTTQLVLIGIFVFLLVVMFGAGRFIIAAVAPKPPPGINAPVGPP